MLQCNDATTQTTTQTTTSSRLRHNGETVKGAESEEGRSRWKEGGREKDALSETEGGHGGRRVRREPRDPVLRVSRDQEQGQETEERGEEHGRTDRDISPSIVLVLPDG